MKFLRTDATEERYAKAKASRGDSTACVLCAETPIVTFEHWKIINNEFPYDLIATVHHMLLPIRHVTEEELSQDERDELLKLKHSELNERYEYLVETTHKTKSIPGHFHIHLLIANRP